MFRAFDFCLPTKATIVPATPDWLHEIKYNGYRLRVERGGERVRLITRGGCDWTKRFPWIVEAALKNRQKRFVIDGEAVILGVDGVSDFDAMHSGKHNDEVQLCAFDILALDGDDYLDALPRFRASAPPPLTGPIAWAGLGQPRMARARSYRSCRSFSVTDKPMQRKRSRACLAPNLGFIRMATGVRLGNHARAAWR